MEKYLWTLGVDWGSMNHQACILDDEGRVRGERSFPHGGEGLRELVGWTLRQTKSAPEGIGVAIETPHGPVVEAVMEAGFDLHSLNPKQLDRFRDRHSPAGAKDDRRDARVLADALRTDPKAFHKQAPFDENTVILRALSRTASDLTTTKNQLANKIRDYLWRYYPQMLEVESDLAKPWVRQLWELVPTPEKAKRIQTRTVAKLLTKNRVRRISAEKILEILRSTPLNVGPGTLEGAQTVLQALFNQLEVVVDELKALDRRIKETTERMSSAAQSDGDGNAQARTEDGTPSQTPIDDVTILRSVPGIGIVVLAILLSEASEALRNRDRRALRCLAGVAPVTKRSGKRNFVTRRMAVHPRLRDAVYYWAFAAVQRDETLKRKYHSLRQRGHTHGRALRSIADRLISVLCAMLRNRTTYDKSMRGANAAN